MKKTKLIIALLATPSTFANTLPPLNQPAAKVIITPSKQSLKEAQQLFSKEKEKDLEKYPTIKPFSIPEPRHDD